MEAMDQQRVTIEIFVARTLGFSEIELRAKAVNSIWWKCVLFISLPFYLLAYSLFLLLAPILVCMRLAVAHADRVVFVLASSVLSFYQVPRKVFYIYMAVVAFTGFLHFLRYKSILRSRFFVLLDIISCRTSSMFLRKFTTLHFSNPFNRRFTESRVIYVPVGFRIHPKSCVQIFDFPVSEHLDFDQIVGNCRIKIGTLDNDIGTSTIRDFHIGAPWGDVRFAVNMENDSLGKLISYFNRVLETKCEELICSPVSEGFDSFEAFEALSILGVVKLFKSGVQLVRLKRIIHFIE